jgi:hypothetical protein
MAKAYLAAQQRAEQIQRAAGIVYNETSGIYPALKPGAKAGGPANWDPASAAALHNARVLAAQIVYGGKMLMADPVFPNVSSLTPNGKAQWNDSLAAATDAWGTRTNNQMVMWPSDNGRTPNTTPSGLASWPYSDTSRIFNVEGPFRVPQKVGDVPAGNNIYFFFYQGKQ